MPRTVTLVVVDPAGSPLGTLPPFDVDVPYWQEVAVVVAGARERYGVDLTVLRVLGGTRGGPTGYTHGGTVTYLAEAAALPAPYAGPVSADLSAHPLRHAYAQPGGPAASLRWAEAALGRGPFLAHRQLRTWNLSTIWQLETLAGTVWLKHVPTFFAHEPVVLRFVARTAAGLVPEVLAADDAGRMLLADVPGTDLYGAGSEVRTAIAEVFHPVQVVAADAVPALIAAGVPDRRDLRELAVVARGDVRLDRPAGRVLRTGARRGRLRPAGHAGPRRPASRQRPRSRRRRPLVLLDWGDSFIGHPAFDVIRLAGGLNPVRTNASCATGPRRWRARFPGSDPGGRTSCCSRSPPCATPRCTPTSSPRSNRPSTPTTPTTSATRLTIAADLVA